MNNLGVRFANGIIKNMAGTGGEGPSPPANPHEI